MLRYTVVDDLGRIINPLLAAGQVHGGVAQGLGQALMENCVYDADSGQLMTASFQDYAMPRADDMPPLSVAFNEHAPCTTNAMGSKGAGEAGTIGALPVLISAISDALGIDHIDMPTTSEKVWRAAQAARSTERYCGGGLCSPTIFLTVDVIGLAGAEARDFDAPARICAVRRVRARRGSASRPTDRRGSRRGWW